ncbi:MAG: hypothetical protein ACJ79K_11185 [Gemmatimonadaceae bacterium]
MKDGLLSVRTFIVPVSILVETIAFLRDMGGHGCEGFVLWSGTLLDSASFHFDCAIIPSQSASVTSAGLLVTVDGEALFQVNKAIHERGEILGAQVHSHPTSAYHSATDDDFPLATLLGALSVVIPNFAREAPKDLDEWAWYRLTGFRRWDPTSDDQTEIVFE